MIFYTIFTIFTIKSLVFADQLPLKTKWRWSRDQSTPPNHLIKVENTFFSTNKWYNGTIGYDGLFNACDAQIKGSKPCTVVQLLNGFWNQTLLPSWILSLSYNCVGYTSSDENTIGMCIQTVYGKQLVPCSCNMAIGICCYH